MALLLTVGFCGLNWRGGWARWCRNLMSSMTISLSDDVTKISVSTEFSAALRFFHVSIFTTHVWAFGGMSVWNWCILIIHLRSSTQHVHACPDFRPSLTPFRFRNSSGWASDIVYAGDELGAEAKHEIFSVVFFSNSFTLSDTLIDCISHRSPVDSLVESQDLSEKINGEGSERERKKK